MTENDETEFIRQCIDHWFIQGGLAQFGDLGDFSENADGLIAAILRIMRREQAASLHSPVLQAVLDAIAGKLDPSTQIADHPNVKFAQMQRLRLLENRPESAVRAQAEDK